LSIEEGVVKGLEDSRERLKELKAEVGFAEEVLEEAASWSLEEDQAYSRILGALASVCCLRC